MHDKLTTCDRCGSDAAYVQEVNEKIKNYMCYGCGFITNSLMTKDSEFFEEQILNGRWIWKLLNISPRKISLKL